MSFAEAPNSKGAVPLTRVSAPLAARPFAAGASRPTCAAIDPSKSLPLIQAGVPVARILNGVCAQARRCACCGHIVFKPPANATLSSFYRRAYARSVEDWRRLQSNGSLTDARVERIERIAGALGLDRGARICELGGANDLVASALRVRGWTVAEADAIRDIPADSPLPLAFSFHALQRAPNPARYLRALRLSPAKPAALMLFTQNAMALEALAHGYERFVQSAFPGHLHLFSPHSAGVVTEAGGWDLVQLGASTCSGDAQTGAVAERLRVEQLEQALLAEELELVLTPKDSSLAAAFSDEIACAAIRSRRNAAFEREVMALAEASPLEATHQALGALALEFNLFK